MPHSYPPLPPGSRTLLIGRSVVFHTFERPVKSFSHLRTTGRSVVFHNFERPVVRLPVVRLPVVRLPVVRLPVVRLPVVRLPVVRLPVVRLPVVRLPVVRLPVVRLPVVRLPVVRLPVVRLFFTPSNDRSFGLIAFTVSPHPSGCFLTVFAAVRFRKLAATKTQSSGPIASVAPHTTVTGVVTL